MSKLPLGLVLVAACAGSRGPVAQPPPPGQVFADADAGFTFLDPDRRRKLAAAFPAIDAAIEEERANQRVPGLVIGIVIDGELAHATGFGVADLATRVKPDADTVYRIGSLAKTFTAMAILALRDRGALGLDDPLARWIPEAGKLVYASRDAPPITLRQLLSHSSGLPWGGRFAHDAPVTDQEVASSLVGMPLENAPGAMVYSNLGFTLLGIVAARAGGGSYHSAVADHVLRPLGMTSTYWRPEDVPPGRLATTYGFGPTRDQPVPPSRLGASDASGGMYSTVRDLARYAALQLAAYPPRNDPDPGPLRRATLRESHTWGVPEESWLRYAIAPRPGDRIAEYRASSWGMGWGAVRTCDFDDIVSKGGFINGHQISFELLVNRGVAVIVLSNFAAANLGAFATRARRELAKTGALVPRVRRLPEAFAPVMKTFLDVYNVWDDIMYHTMLDPQRPSYPIEREEIAGYRALHGACTGFAPVVVASPLQARIALQCERGAFELDVSLSPESELITGFTGTSRGVAAPAAVAAVADAVAALIGAWSADAYARLAGDGKAAAAQASFDDLRAAHGACRVSAMFHQGLSWVAELACERGGGLVVELGLDGGKLTGHRFRAPPGCPTR